MHANKQLFAFLFILYQNFYMGFTGVLLKRLENCDPNGNDRYKYNLTVKTVNEKQYLSGVAFIRQPFNNSVRISVDVKIFSGDKYFYLFSVNENKGCEALHKYFGEFAYDIERRIGLIPGACPIPKDTYHMYNLPFDCNKITTASNFPFGNLRLVIHAYDSKNKELSCFNSDVEHSVLRH